MVNLLLRHAQVDVGTDFLREGINPNQDLSEINEQLRNILGYRIPQQGKSSMLILRSARFSRRTKSTIRVPRVSPHRWVVT